MDLITIFFKVCLFFANGYFIVPFLIWGFFYYDRKVFVTTAMFCLCSSVVNFYLKTVFKVPLDIEAVGHAGWAFPSGHTTLNCVLWFSLMLQLRKRWTYYCGIAINTGAIFGMLYFKYHTIVDILGGAALAVLFMIPLYIWIRFNFKKVYFLGLALFFVSFSVLYLIPAEDIFERLYANIGVLLGLTLFEHLKAYRLSQRLVYYKKRSLYYILCAIAILYASTFAIELIKYDGKSDYFIMYFVSVLLALIASPLVINRVLRERVLQDR